MSTLPSCSRLFVPARSGVPTHLWSVFGRDRAGWTRLKTDAAWSRSAGHGFFGLFWYTFGGTSARLMNAKATASTMSPAACSGAHAKLQPRVHSTGRIERACTECLSRRGCGFCLSTGACLEGDDEGPANSVSCPYWLASRALCPIEPTCDDYIDCGTCVSDDSCAWCVRSPWIGMHLLHLPRCASQERCMDLTQM